MIRPEDIIKCTAQFYRMPECMLRDRTRKREIIHAKHIAVSLMKDNTKLSLREIGCLFNLKVHASVLHAIKSVNDQADVYKDYAEELKILRLRLLADDLELRHDNILTYGWS